jgi:hypothetical protein
MSDNPLLIMAEALERSSVPPGNDQPIGEFIFNDAFQTMAGALREAARDHDFERESADDPVENVLRSDPLPVDQGSCLVCGEPIYLEPIGNPLDGTGGIWWVWVHTRYVYNRTHPAEPCR